MPGHFTEIVLALLSVIFLALYTRDRLRQQDASKPARTAWLRVGIIFGVISIVLFYLHSSD
jgi:cytochrome bd-type quinol oxidase subunit 2